MDKILLDIKNSIILKNVGIFFVPLFNIFKMFFENKAFNFKSLSRQIDDQSLLKTQSILKRTAVLKERVLEEIKLENNLQNGLGKDEENK